MLMSHWLGLLLEASVSYIHAASPPSGSSPPPAKEPVPAVTANSTTTSATQLQNSEAFAAVAQLFQSSQGQQVGAFVHSYFPCIISVDTPFEPSAITLLSLSITGTVSFSRCSRTFSSSQWSQTATLSLLSITFKHILRMSPLAKARSPHNLPCPMNSPSRRQPLTRWRYVFVFSYPINRLIKSPDSKQVRMLSGNI